MDRESRKTDTRERFVEVENELWSPTVKARGQEQLSDFPLRISHGLNPSTYTYAQSFCNVLESDIRTSMNRDKFAKKVEPPLREVI